MEIKKETHQGINFIPKKDAQGGKVPEFTSLQANTSSSLDSLFNKMHQNTQ